MITKRLFRGQVPLRYGSADESGYCVRFQTNHRCHSKIATSPAWYEFWTGTSQLGGREIDAEAPLDRIPLYVRAGSILPLGPEIEYADEKPAGPIELRIYGGADGKFDLYQDAGDNYEYENGAYSIIPLQWSQSTRTLTVGDRQGRFPEMPVSMQIKIVWVSGGHGADLAPVANPDKTVEYAGKAISVQAP